MIRLPIARTRPIIVALFIFSIPIDAEVPQLMNYQGRLVDSLGNPLDTVANLEFGIYNSGASITPAWSETHTGVTVTDGLFNVLLGSVTPIPAEIFNGSIRQLATAFEGGLMGAERIAITSVAYAIRSVHSDTAEYAHAGTLEQL